MSTRKVHLAPTFSLIDMPKEFETTIREIKKMKPEVEVTLEGSGELAKGKIVEWFEKRKFFTVKWEKKTQIFDKKIEDKPGLRAFFKGQLFSTQILFKSTTIRRIDEETYHYRIPDQIYKQQRRGALRVPIGSGIASLETPRGSLNIIDLSITGAKLKSDLKKIPVSFFNIILEPCELVLGKRRIGGEGFEIRITHVSDQYVGVRFQGLGVHDNRLIKQFLIDQLRVFYQGV